MIPHIMIIQAAYSDPELSARRLNIARNTSIVSLAFQTQKPVVHIAVNPSDPHCQQRLDAYRATGCEVRPLFRDSWRLYRENWELPEGRKIVSRMDDDDVIAKDFCEATRNAAPASGEMAMIWPNGYVFWRQMIFLLKHRGNQFVTLVTDEMKDPHQEQHWGYHKRWPSRVVSNQPGWIWVRHGDAATSTLPRYRKSQVGRIDSRRIPVNLRAIVRATEPSGKPSGSYAEHRSPHIGFVLRENNAHAQ